MSDPMMTQETIKEALQSVQSNRYDRLIKRFGINDLLYLALVPAWTYQLAQECHFPASKPLEQFLTEALAAGICQKSESGSFTQTVWYTAHIYTSLAPYLPASYLDEALKYVLNIEDILLQVQSLARLLPLLPSTLSQHTMQTALGILDKVKTPRDRITIQLMLIPYLSEGVRLPIMQDALAIIRQIPYPDEQIHALKSLIPYLPTSSLLAPLEIINSIAQERVYAEGLMALVPFLEGKQRLSLLKDAQYTIDAIEDQNIRTWLLSLLAENYAHSQDFSTVFSIISHMRIEVAITTMTRIIRDLALAPGLVAKDDFTKQAIEFARELAQDALQDVKRVYLVCELAQALFQLGQQTIVHKLAKQMYSAVLDAKESFQRIRFVQILCTLAQIWNPEEADSRLKVMIQAYITISSMSDALERCRGLTMLANTSKTLFGKHTSGLALTERYEKTVLSATSSLEQTLLETHALETARTLSDPKERVQELIELASLISLDDVPLLLEELLILAQGMNKTLSFWMPDSAKNELLAAIKGQQATLSLLQKAQQIGQQICIAQEKRIPLPPTVVHWAAMAKAGPEGSADLLTSEVQGLLEEGNTIQAMVWITTATPLCEVFKGSLEMAVLLGKRRVELAYRQLQDKRSLQYLLVRQEQVDAFHKLVKNTEKMHRDISWALHYIGMGGVGKTTLIRYITAVLTPEMKIPTCRVDFDYLNPDYPVRKPGQLLIELAQELQFYGVLKRHEQLFREFQQRVVAYHEKLSNEPFSTDPLDNTKRPEFEKVIRTFCEFISHLPQPVVFILDTCEELTRFQPTMGKLPNVEATFNVLERIHAQVSSIRVIFAGRRLLAQSGDGWFLDTSQLREGQALLPQHKSYLQLHEIRGFSRKEMQDFFTTTKKLSLSREMVDAILKRSPDTGRVAPLKLLHSAQQTKESRYNPFYLSLYADWVQESPTLTPAEIAKGKTDPFVEMRIIGRIKRDDVRDLLPALLLLRRFDKTMLRAVFRGNPATFDELFWELGNLEWLEYQLEEKNAFLEISRPLYQRLWEYYDFQEERHAKLEAASKQLVSGLTALIDGLALGDLRLNHIEAVLRILPQEQGTQLWERLSRRITEEEAWDWARPITAHLLSEDGVVDKLDHKAHALILATHIAVTIHEKFYIDRGPLWEEVRRAVTSGSAQPTEPWLLQRVLAGRVAAMPLTKPLFSQNLLNASFWSLVNEFSESLASSLEADPFHTEQLAGSLCAAIEALLEKAETLDRADLLPDPVQVVNWSRKMRSSDFPLVLQAFSVMLAGRTMALHKRWEEANALFLRACALQPDTATYQTWQRQRWEDWHLPSSVVDHIRLQYLHIMPRHLLTIDRDRLLSWQAEASSRLQYIDAERLVSAILNWRLAHEVITATELEKLTELRAISDYKPDCNAHRETLPLAVTCALVLLAIGRAEDALHILDAIFEGATTKGDDTGNISQIATLTRLYIIHRMRLSDPVSSYQLEQAIRSSNPENLALALPALALTTAQGTTPKAESLGLEYDDSLEKRHAWWRSQIAWTKDIVTPSVIRLLREESERDENSKMARLLLDLDYYEATLLSEQYAIPDPNVAFKFPGLEEAFERYPDRAEQCVRLMLRSYALGIAGEKDAEDVIEQWALRLGKRWIAELALNEGEMLALRLPEQAGKLLELATQWFATVNDPVGVCIAATCSCLSLIHAGETAELAVTLQHIQDGYSKLVESKKFALPPWAVLTSLSYSWHGIFELKDIKDKDDMIGRDTWKSWLERIKFCVLYEKAAAEKRLDKLSKELTNELGKNGLLSLPVELTLLSPNAKTKRRRVTVMTETAPRQPARRESRVDLSATVSLAATSVNLKVSVASRTITVISMILSLSLFIVLGYAGYLLLNTLSLASNPSVGCRNCTTSIFSAYANLYPVWKISIYIFLLILLGVCGWFIRRPILRFLRFIRASIITRSFIRVYVLPAEKYSAPVSLEASVGVRLRLQWRAIRSKIIIACFRMLEEAILALVPLSPSILHLLRAVLPASEHLNTDIVLDTITPTLQPYRNAAEKIPSEVRQLLTRLQTYLVRRQLAVPLVVAPGLEGICWESLFYLAPNPQQTQEWYETFQCWRTGDPLPADNPSDVITRRDSHGIGVLAHPTWDYIISEGWHSWVRQATGGTHERFQLMQHTTLHALRNQENQAIIHVIGNPIVTVSGLHLRISAPYRFESSSTYEQTIRSEEMNLLLRGDDLLRSSVQLVILQAEPIEIERRLETDREQAYDLRNFAAGIFAAGARAVIMLPSLPPALAKVVLNELATTLREHSLPKHALLLRMVSRARCIVATWTPPNSQEQSVDVDTLRELALDICLFARWEKMNVDK